MVSFDIQIQINYEWKFLKNVVGKEALIECILENEGYFLRIDYKDKVLTFVNGGESQIKYIVSGLDNSIRILDYYDAESKKHKENIVKLAAYQRKNEVVEEQEKQKSKVKEKNGRYSSYRR